MQMALKKGRPVITGYRDHGHMLATGMEAKGVMAERPDIRQLFKGGAAHACSAKKNFFGARHCQAQVSLGTGLAFTNRYRGNDFCQRLISATARRTRPGLQASTWRSCGSFGDLRHRESMGVGDAHPPRPIFQARHLLQHSGGQVDGMDIRAVKAAGDKAVQWCRGGNGPFIHHTQIYPATAATRCRTLRNIAPAVDRCGVGTRSSGSAIGWRQDERTGIEGDRRRGARDRQRCRRLRAAIPSRCVELYTDIYRWRAA